MSGGRLYFASVVPRTAAYAPATGPNAGLAIPGYTVALVAMACLWALAWRWSNDQPR